MKKIKAIAELISKQVIECFRETIMSQGNYQLTVVMHLNRLLMN
jgi:hypothetical protein